VGHVEVGHLSFALPDGRTQQGLMAYQGTILAVTHDRWFARSFDRFLIFGADGADYASGDPVWDEARVARAR
jgi:ATPase subunit of ABC transporter with duplicated ATPase domains